MSGIYWRLFAAEWIMPRDENIIIHIPTEEDESEKLKENITK
jgi:vacuolar-type H+-ATPase subunit F/Vma7